MLVCRPMCLFKNLQERAVMSCAIASATIDKTCICTIYGHPSAAARWQRYYHQSRLAETCPLGLPEKGVGMQCGREEK
jgi:hypothetical protein